MADSFMSQHGLLLAGAGYSILPIQPGTKKPGQYYAPPGIGWTDMSRWTEFCSNPASEGMIQRWCTYPDAGVGIACGNIIAVDIDILDEAIASVVEDTIRLTLGETPLKRVGMAPKRLLVYRAAEPFKKITAGPIEVLAEGQQFVAFGIHPATGLDYSWGDLMPYDVPVHLLPVVTRQQVQEAVSIALDLVPGFMRSRARSVEPAATRVSGFVECSGTSVLGLQAHRDAVSEATASISNPDLDWDAWNKVGMAIYGASGGADWGKETFEAWSGKSEKDEPHETKDRWAHYHRSPPTRLGAGTLFKMALDEGWVPSPGLDFQSGVMSQEEREEIRRMIARLLGNSKARDCQQALEA